MFFKNRALLAKIEATYGTDPVPVAGTDAVQVTDLDLKPVNGDFVDRNLIRGFFGGSPQLPANINVQVTCTVELAGYKTPGTLTPPIDALLEACAFTGTATDAQVTYAPISTGMKSATLYFWQDGTIMKVSGCRGTFTIDMEVGKVPTLQFTMTGLYQAPSDVAMTGLSFTNFNIPCIVNSENTTSVSLLGASPALSKFSLQMGNTMAYRDLPGGTKQELITDRKVTGSVSIEDTLVATEAWDAAIYGATIGALSVTHGPVGNQVIIAASNAQLTAPTFTNDSGVILRQMTLACFPSTAGNDDLTITFK